MTIKKTVDEQRKLLSLNLGPASQANREEHQVPKQMDCCHSQYQPSARFDQYYFSGSPHSISPKDSQDDDDLYSLLVRGQEAANEDQMDENSRVQIHFHLKPETLKRVRATEWTEICLYEECFFDDADASLALNNKWLKYVVEMHKDGNISERISLKTLDASVASDSFVKYQEIQGEDRIRSLLDKSISEYNYRVANFTVNRFMCKISSKLCVYVDSAIFASEDFYLVGTLSFMKGITEDEIRGARKLLSDHKISRPGPVRSKVIEYIRVTDTLLYQQLIERGIVKSTTCEKIESHYQDDPFDEEQCEGAGLNACDAKALEEVAQWETARRQEDKVAARISCRMKDAQKKRGI